MNRFLISFACGWILAACFVTTTARAEASPRFEFYGFIKADVIYDFRRLDPNWSSVMRPSQILIRDDDTPYYDDGEIILSVRATRLGANFTDHVGTHPVHGQFEVDFFGRGTSESQHLPRIRQAWISYRGVLVGQAWSLFNDADAWPQTLDFWGPCGMLASRRPQLRWTARDTDHSVLAVALEQPGAGVDSGKAPQYDPELDVRPRSVLPDLTASFRQRDARGHWQAAVVFRDLGYEGTTDLGGDGRTFAGSEFGWGLYLSTHRDVGERNGFNATFYYGEGIGNYANDGGVDVGPTDDLEAVPLPLLGWHASYDGWWNATWSTSLGLSGNHQQNSGGQEDEAFRAGTYAFINLIHQPEKRLSYGVEFLWGHLKRFDRRTGEDFRLQASGRLVF